MRDRRGGMGALLAPLARAGGQRLLRGTAWALLGLEVLALVVVGADRPAKPHVLDPAAVVATQGRSVPGRVPGFNQVGFRVVAAGRGGLGRPGCALLADTAQRQARGLMGRRDLAGYDAMIFPFAARLDRDVLQQGRSHPAVDRLVRRRRRLRRPNRYGHLRPRLPAGRPRPAVPLRRGGPEGPAGVPGHRPWVGAPRRRGLHLSVRTGRGLLSWPVGTLVPDGVSLVSSTSLYRS